MRILSILLLFIIIGCNSQKSTTDDTIVVHNNTIKDPNTVEITQAEIPLSVYLSRIAGVNVRGSGSDAVVLVRTGGNSLTSSSEPLFLIDGNQFNGDFSSLSQIISVSQIKSVTVYKNASETAMYGVQGANGVVDIRLKQ